MKTERITQFGKEFLRIELACIEQKGKQFYLGKITADDFVKLFTVEPAEYDVEKQIIMQRKFPDDESYYKYLTGESKKRIDQKAFERKEEKSRIRQIKTFLEQEEYALFPNSIIVSCDLINDQLGASWDTGFEEIGKSKLLFDSASTLSFLDTSEETLRLYVPYVKNSILIIDGQHRIRGLQEADPKKIGKYELLVTFVIGYDRSVIAKLFYTINYTQKSVSKSLLYHLSGEFSTELNELTFLHEVVRMLNELEHSPFRKRIKMLGYVPANGNEQERKLMTVSQAFLIDYLRPMISKNQRRSIYAPIFLHYYKN